MAFTLSLSRYPQSSKVIGSRTMAGGNVACSSASAAASSAAQRLQNSNSLALIVGGGLWFPTMLNQSLQIWREEESYRTIFYAPRVLDVPSLCSVVPFCSKLLPCNVFLRIGNAQQGTCAFDEYFRGLRGFTFCGTLLFAFDFDVVVVRAGEFGD